MMLPRVYVAPGEYDKFYGFFSGGFSDQVSVYGIPSVPAQSHSGIFRRREKRVWL